MVCNRYSDMRSALRTDIGSFMSEELRNKHLYRGNEIFELFRSQRIQYIVRRLASSLNVLSIPAKVRTTAKACNPKSPPINEIYDLTHLLIGKLLYKLPSLILALVTKQEESLIYDISTSSQRWRANNSGFWKHDH